MSDLLHRCLFVCALCLMGCQTQPAPVQFSDGPPPSPTAEAAGSSENTAELEARLATVELELTALREGLLGASVVTRETLAETTKELDLKDGIEDGRLTAKPGPSEATTDPSKGTNSDGHIVGKSLYPCSGHTICELESPKDGTLMIAQGGAKSIDPSHASETAGFFVIENIFEGLIIPSMRTGPPAPGVAKTWDVSKDGLTYTFHLRKDARWSNGRGIRAEDFRYSWMRKLDPMTASSTAEHHFFIKGAKQYNKGRNKDPESVGIKVVDDFTLEVSLENPTTYFLEYVKSGHYSPVPKETVEKHGKAWTRPENIVTNGAYHLQEWLPRDKMIFVKSPTYWDAAKVKIPRVLVHYTENETQQWTRYQAGDQHVVDPVKNNLIPQFMNENRPDFFIDPYLCYYYYAFRLDKAPFDQLKVRQAFAMAIDKERLVTHVTRGMQIPADGPVPTLFDQTAGFPSAQGLGFDPDAARALLASAGYPNGAGLPTITLVYNTFESHKKIAEFVQRNLQENLGVKVELANMEWKSLMSKLNSGDFQIARYGWCAVNDPISFLKKFKSDSANNVFGYSSPAVDKLLEQSLATKEHDARMNILGKVEKHLQNDLPNLPLYYYTKPYLKVPVLRGWEPESGNRHLIKYMYWGDKEY
jgi:oligopeptide transport system substrate-binding protein